MLLNATRMIAITAIFRITSSEQVNPVVLKSTNDKNKQTAQKFSNMAAEHKAGNPMQNRYV